MDFLGDPNGRRLFEQVVAAPASMAPRAVLADWLLERGDPLGGGGSRPDLRRRARHQGWPGQRRSPRS